MLSIQGRGSEPGLSPVTSSLTLPTLAMTQPLPGTTFSMCKEVAMIMTGPSSSNGCHKDHMSKRASTARSSTMLGTNTFYHP